MRLLGQHLRQYATFYLLGIVTAYVAACGATQDLENRQNSQMQEQPPADTDATDAVDPVDAHDQKDGPDEVVESPTKFAAPSQMNEPTVNGAYEIKVAFAEQPLGTTWSLFYTRTEGDQTGGTIILAEQPLTIVNYKWTMGGLDEGVYFFYLVLNYESGGTAVVSATGSITHSGVGSTVNVSPQITALDAEFSAGTRLVTTIETVDMAYNVFDADGDAITVKIELSSDGGVTYDKVLATDAPHDGFSWNVATSGVEEGLYHLRITASDGLSLPDERTSSAPFAVVNDGTTYTYEADIRAILASNCLGCHDSGGAGFSVFAWDTYGTGPSGAPNKFAGYMSNRISTLAVDFETMPKGNAPLTADERSKIKIWYLQGAPEN